MDWNSFRRCRSSKDKKDEFDYARTAISLGVTDYLLKPFTPTELHNTFEKIIRELDSQNMLKQNLQMLRQQAAFLGNTGN